MNEFSLIDHFFKSIAVHRSDVALGIGDDAAILELPPGHQLLVSTDALVADVHFGSTWDAYDIAYKAVMVNVSDIAAMGAYPSWASLSLTLPALDAMWLDRFSQGLHDALAQYQVALIGGDTTKGPLSMTLTIHGFVPTGRAIRRAGAKPGDVIYVTGELGAAALAVHFLTKTGQKPTDFDGLLQCLKRPRPRIDWVDCLQAYASAAIDISDGLAGDLNHICMASNVGALLIAEDIPVHPLVQQSLSCKEALDFALSGGDDYELCLTVPPERETSFLARLASIGLKGHAIGVIDAVLGLRMKARGDEQAVPLSLAGYTHF